MISWESADRDGCPDLIKSEYIDLSPDYQRDVVWTSSKMICLIQSVMLVRVFFASNQTKPHNSNKSLFFNTLTEILCTPINLLS